MDINLIKLLRDQTGVGMGECKEALEEASNDMNLAVEILRKKGAMKAVKKTERTANEGYIASYIHPNGKIAAMVQLSCETDFVARNEDFRNLTRDIAMQVASENPLFLSLEDVSVELLEKEKEIYREQLVSEGKTADMIEKILPGKLNKFYGDVCLLEQTYIKDDMKKIKDLLSEAVLKLGENIFIARFVRFQV
jgi:elongation factor Ts